MLIENTELQKKLYDQAMMIADQNHDKEKNRAQSEVMFERMIENSRKKNEL